MPTFKTNLLVRDKRVPLFEAQGCSVAWKRLDDAAFEAALRTKLVEEAQEAAGEQNPADLLKELADIYEVVNALATLTGRSMADVQAQADARREKLGGFENRVFTESLTAPEGSENAEYHRQYPEKYPEVK